MNTQEKQELIDELHEKVDRLARAIESVINAPLEISNDQKQEASA